MMNSTDNNQESSEEVQFEEEGGSEIENLLRAVILAYQEAYNRNSEKNEIKFSLTITTHKIPTEDGNKDVAYLRLDRSIKEKGIDTEWADRLLHQEAYFFRDMKERLNPKAPWKDQLFVNCLARLTGAGLEYAELLQRLKQAEVAKEKAGITDEEQRLENLGLVKANSITELTEDDKKYAEHIKAERAKEGL